MPRTSCPRTAMQIACVAPRYPVPRTVMRGLVSDSAMKAPTDWIEFLPTGDVADVFRGTGDEVLAGNQIGQHWMQSKARSGTGSTHCRHVVAVAQVERSRAHGEHHSASPRTAMRPKSCLRIFSR